MGAHGQGYARPAGSPHGSRSAAMAPHGMVAASQPLAARVGLEILESGGNAVDAAVATNAMLGLVEPHMNGIGGDLFAIVWDAESQQMYGLNATGRSGHAFTRAALEREGFEEVPSSGPVSWMVPGTVDGWAELLDRFGTMSLDEVLAPAIAYAHGGFPVTEIIAHQWQGQAESLSRWPDSARTYLPGGRAPRAGEVFRNPDLGRSYELIAEQGIDGFYRGPIAEQIAAFAAEHGGYLTMRDFAEHDSTWVDPVSSSYRGHDVWELPPNSHGITALMMLNILEGWDMASLGHNSAATLHRIVEAKKLAFADRARWVADPEAGEIPIAELISKSYADRRRRRIDPDRVGVDMPAGDPLEQGDTVYLSVVDEDRNAVSLIQSIFSYFGSQVVPGEVGFAMQNRATGFTMEPGHLNEAGPHKRSLHTNMPGMVTREGRPWLVFGVMGGTMQPQGHTQVLMNLIDFGMNVQEAGDAARIRHTPDTPPGVLSAEGGTILVEPGISAAVVAQLEEMGHRTRRVDGGDMGGYQAIFIDLESGMLQGGSDPRKDGLAIGY